MRTVGVYVRTGPARRLPKGPPPGGHVYDQADGLHWFTHRDGVVSCSVCGPVYRMRRGERGKYPQYRPVGRRRAVTDAVALTLLACVVTAVWAVALLHAR